MPRKPNKAVGLTMVASRSRVVRRPEAMGARMLVANMNAGGSELERRQMGGGNKTTRLTEIIADHGRP